MTARTPQDYHTGGKIERMGISLRRTLWDIALLVGAITLWAGGILGLFIALALLGRLM